MRSSIVESILRRMMRLAEKLDESAEETLDRFDKSFDDFDTWYDLCIHPRTLCTACGRLYREDDCTEFEPASESGPEEYLGSFCKSGCLSDLEVHGIEVCGPFSLAMAKLISISRFLLYPLWRIHIRRTKKRDLLTSVALRNLTTLLGD